MGTKAMRLEGAESREDDIGWKVSLLIVATISTIALALVNADVAIVGVVAPFSISN